MNIQVQPFGIIVFLLSVVEFAAALAIGVVGLRVKAPGATAPLVIGSLVLAITLCGSGPVGTVLLGNFQDVAGYDVARDVLDVMDLVALSVGLGCIAVGIWSSSQGGQP